MFFIGGDAHLILNPSAGRGRAGRLRVSASRFFEERGLRPVWHVTQGPGHAGSIVRGLPEEVSVVAVGGDGTAHEVAAGVPRARAYLGGTGRSLWSVGRLLKDFRCHEARHVIDSEVVEVKTILVAVALGTTYG